MELAPAILVLRWWTELVSPTALLVKSGLMELVDANKEWSI
jgi:hypothetical protein